MKGQFFKDRLEYIMGGAEIKVDECLDEKVTLFIDDKESHCEEVSKAGIDVLLFTNEYNKEENRFTRVNNWNEVEKYIEEKYNG